MSNARDLADLGKSAEAIDVDASAPADSLNIDSSGDVGIGTTSPSSFYSGANNFVVGDGSGATGMSIFSGTTDTGRIYFADGTSGAELYAGYVEYSHNINKMQFGTNGGTKAVIDSSGNVGIGTNSPSFPLTTYRSSAGTIAEFRSADGTYNPRFSIYGDSSGTHLHHTWSSSAGNLIFEVGGSAGTNEKMRIDDSGRVTMPYQPAFSATNPGINVSGALVFSSALFNNGSHYSTSTGRFTAPISGMYYFYVQTLANSGMFDISFYKNGTRLLGHSESQESTYKTVSNAQIIYMNANDYVDARVWDGSSYGSDYSIFTGYLLG